LARGIETRHCQLVATAIACANDECQEITIDLWVKKGNINSKGGYVPGDVLSHHRLRPRSKARHWPEFVPIALREDYEEACLIVGLSPKGAAALCRRCLQGMIRDFCEISKPTLAQEIKTLRARVDEGAAPKGVEPETMDAIDAVRSVGNIGAHMEKDVNLIVPVEPQEAEMLIGLLELLFEEWYVARDTRVKRLSNLKSLAVEKAAARSNKSDAPGAPEPAVMVISENSSDA
jgi:hypothetical protein